MSEQSTHLLLSYLASGQAQKHITVNESLRRLDALVQLSVVSASTTAEPGSPADGDIYVLPSAKSGSHWSAFTAGALAYYRDSAWEQVTPREGWIAYVRDVDRAIVYTGTVWAPLAVALGVWRVLAASAVAVSHTGNTSETTLATVAVPANAMGANGALRVFTQWSYSNSANAKTPRVRFGGTAFFAPALTTTAAEIGLTVIQNRNTTNSQVAQPAAFGTTLGSSSAAATTGAIDTSVAQDITLTAQLANSGETLTLERYMVEVLYGA